MTSTCSFICECRKSVLFLALAAGVLALATGVLAPLAEGKQSRPPREPHYRPHLLASVDEAAGILEQLTPFLTNGQGENASCVVVGQSGLKIFWDEQAAESSQHPLFVRIRSGEANPALPAVCAFTHLFSMRYAEANSLGYDTGDAGRLTIRLCMRDNTCQSVQSRLGTGQDRVLMNALLTLIVAGGNPDVVALDTPWSSITAQPKLAKKLNKKFNLLDAGFVAMVQSGSPSEAAGLRDGDLITAINGAAYRENLYGELAAKCLKAEPEGCILHVGGLRKGKLFTGKIPVKPVVGAVEVRTQPTGAAAAAFSAHASSPVKLLTVPPQEKPAPSPRSFPSIEPAPVFSTPAVPALVPAPVATPGAAPEAPQKKSAAKAPTARRPKVGTQRKSVHRRPAKRRVKRPAKTAAKPAAQKPEADAKKPTPVSEKPQPASQKPLTATK
jgi:hypothetical protein